MDKDKPINAAAKEQPTSKSARKLELSDALAVIFDHIKKASALRHQADVVQRNPQFLIERDKGGIRVQSTPAEALDAASELECEAAEIFIECVAAAWLTIERRAAVEGARQ